jgi:hypothetical protein
MKCDSSCLVATPITLPAITSVAPVGYTCTLQLVRVNGIEAAYSSQLAGRLLIVFVYCQDLGGVPA